MSTPRLTVDDLDALIAEVEDDLAYCRAHGMKEWADSCAARLWSLNRILAEREKELRKGGSA